MAHCSPAGRNRLFDLSVKNALGELGILGESGPLRDWQCSHALDQGSSEHWPDWRHRDPLCYGLGGWVDE